MGRGSMRNRWLPAVAMGMSLALGVGMAGCTSSPDTGGGDQPKDTGKVQPAAVTTPPKVRLIPGSHTDVNPTNPIKVAVSDGTISTVKLVNEAGKSVKGTMSADKHAWQVAEPLGYGKTYTWSGTATNTSGKQTPIKGRFHTLTPQGEIDGSLNVGDGQTYGIAMPVVLTFDSPVADKKAVQRRLSVQASTPTEGSWAWLDDYSVHYRPKTYWKPGTTVKVNAWLYGAHMDSGVYGAQDVAARFKIGADQRVLANAASHHMAVFKNGKRVAVYPASFGLDSDPGRVTHSGVHVVMSKSSSYSMSNPQYGYHDVVVQWAVRISNNGEFVHAYPGSVWAQGNTNVSHGCINLSDENGLAYYKFAQVGDPVNVVGSSEKLGAADGDYYDWALSWHHWQAKSAL